MPVALSSMILSERPEWVAEWNASGSSSACSKKVAMTASRRRWASRSESSETTTAAAIEASAKPIQARIVGISASRVGRCPSLAPWLRLLISRPSSTGSANWVATIATAATTRIATARFSLRSIASTRQ